MHALPPRRSMSAFCSSRRLVLQGVGVSILGLSPLRPATAGATSAPSSMADVELREAERRAALCSASNVAGTGLRGEYFADDKASGKPLLVRVDTTVDFDRTLEWPDGAAGARPRSAQWRGWIKAPISGRYRFHTSQPRSTLVVSRQSMLGPQGEDGDAIELTAGRLLPGHAEGRRARPAARALGAGVDVAVRRALRRAATVALPADRVLRPMGSCRTGAGSQ